LSSLARGTPVLARSEASQV